MCVDKVGVSNYVYGPEYTPIFECYMVGHESHNIHQKGMCSTELEL